MKSLSLPYRPPPPPRTHTRTHTLRCTPHASHESHPFVPDQIFRIPPLPTLHKHCFVGDLQHVTTQNKSYLPETAEIQFMVRYPCHLSPIPEPRPPPPRTSHTTLPCSQSRVASSSHVRGSVWANTRGLCPASSSSLHPPPSLTGHGEGCRGWWRGGGGPVVRKPQP